METVLAADVLWRLEDLYQGPHDPRIEADQQWCRERADKFAAAYGGRVAKLEAEELLEAIRKLEQLQERALKPFCFAYLHFVTQVQDSTASALVQSTQEFTSLLRRDVLFFELEWTQLEEKQALAVLNQPALAPYRHYLESLRRYKDHMLTEIEERLLAEKEPVGVPAWNNLFDKILSQLRFGTLQRTESEVLSDLYHEERAVRRQAAEELSQGLEGVIHILTHIFNTILLDKAITDRIRKYPHWLRARNLGNEADDRMVDALVSASCARYDMVGRYYRLKQKLLGYEEMFDYDRYAPIPGLPQKLFSWEEAREIVLTAYGKFSSQLEALARRFFHEQWIHAPIFPGKRSGAFAHPTIPSVHPYILLNYAGKPRDIMTLAHELGHGIHQTLAGKQGLINSETPLTTAETASVFGEMLVFQHLLQEMENPRQRVALLCSKLEDIFATVFRQVAMNRFEDAVHNERRQKGELSTDRIGDLWMQTQQAMFGGSIHLSEHYRTWWSYIPHFVHSPGYVYAYAFGELLVLALYKIYQNTGASFVPLYTDLLTAGGNARPNELLLPFGIELSDPDFWNQGLTALEDLLARAENEMNGCQR